VHFLRDLIHRANPDFPFRPLTVHNTTVAHFTRPIPKLHPRPIHSPIARAPHYNRAPMRRLTRLLLNTLTLLSLTLCVFIAYLWITSLHQGWEATRDQLHPGAQGYVEDYAAVSGGGIDLRHEDWTVPPNPARAERPLISSRESDRTPSPEHHLRRTDSADYPRTPTLSRWAVARETVTEPPYTVARTAIVLPCWSLFLLSAILPAIWLLTRLRHPTPHPEP
jgi:hypothetical protein